MASKKDEGGIIVVVLVLLLVFGLTMLLTWPHRASNVSVPSVVLAFVGATLVIISAAVWLLSSIPADDAQAGFTFLVGLIMYSSSYLVGLWISSEPRS